MVRGTLGKITVVGAKNGDTSEVKAKVESYITHQTLNAFIGEPASDGANV